jgi:hypothetical protein
VRCIWTLALLALTAAGADWQRINAGPFEIYTNGNLREAKALLGTLEQMRGQLADLTGLEDPKPLWPVRLVVDKEQATGKLTLTTGVYSLLLKEAALTREQKRGLLQLMLDANAGPLDRQLEDGFLTVLASLTATGVRVTVGVPPPVGLQTADWVLMQYLITNDAYRGRVRVMLGNLMRGTDKASAVRNAFEKDEETLRVEAAKQRGSFAPTSRRMQGGCNWRLRNWGTWASALKRGRCVRHCPPQNQRHRRVLRWPMRSKGSRTWRHWRRRKRWGCRGCSTWPRWGSRTV